MRLRSVVAVVSCCGFAVATVACGDGEDQARIQQREPRGTIDGIPLHTADTLPATTTSTTEPFTFPTFDEPEPDDSPFGWVDYGGGVDEGELEVPLDYADPDGDTITLYLARHRADDEERRIGTLLVNPGGPGFGGTGLAWNAENIYGQELLDRFDIIGWDPRGTGYSEPWVDCVDDLDRYFGIDSSPDDDAERLDLIARATEFAGKCEQWNGDLLPFLSTENSARDIDRIRQALGEDTISYFGFSYGSELGATWATLFPDTVRAAVLDGAIDPTVGYLQQNLQQAAGFEAALAAFLADCSDDVTCPFHHDGDAEGAFDLLSAAIDATPVSVDPQRTKVTQGVLHSAVSSALYDEAGWAALAAALADLEDGDGQGILDLYDEYYNYYGDGTWSDALEAYFTVNCLDDPGSTGVEDLYAHEAEFAAAAPRLGRSWLLELTICAVWPVDPVTPVTITGAGAGPILVVGTTGDAATPIDSTRKMAETLEDGHLVVVAANQHTGYGVNNCVNATVDDYLVDPTARLAGETDCR